MIVIITRDSGTVRFVGESVHDAAVFMWGKDFLNYWIYVSAEPLPFRSADICEFESDLKTEMARQTIERAKRDKATFHDIQGRERCYNVWYAMPFVVYTRIHDWMAPFERIPVADPLMHLLFWKTSDGKIWHATTNMFARIENKTHWGLFNEGWYEI